MKKDNKWVIDDDFSPEDLIVELTDEDRQKIDERHKEYGIKG